MRASSAITDATYPIGRTASYGVLGGLVGALVMGLLALMMPIPNTGGAPFFVAAAMMMGMGVMATVAGWSSHLVTGIIIGAIFASLVAKVSALHPRTTARATGLGAVAGIVVWLVFFMPMMVMLMPALTSMPMMIGGSLVAHLVFGLILGGVTALAIARGDAPFRCEACGQTFNTREALKRHGEMHMSTPVRQSAAQPGFKCNACGMAFQNQEALAEHAKQAHQLPAR